MELLIQVLILIIIVAVGLGVRRIRRSEEAAGAQREMQRQESERRRLEETERRERAEAQRREDEAGSEARYVEWLHSHRDTIDRFMEITERKVSVVDEYGDENWDALDKEVMAVAKKIAKKDGYKLHGWFPERIDHARYDTSEYVRMLLRLKTDLDRVFRRYHAARKSRQESGFISPDLDRMDGIEFESFLVKVLKDDLGLENIGSTPVTGDQGADLIASKDGRIIAIQAKRYTGPVGNSAIQEIVAALRFYKADEGWVITNSTSPLRRNNWLMLTAYVWWMAWSYAT